MTILLDVSLRGPVERFLHDSTRFVGCCFELRRWTAPKSRYEDYGPFRLNDCVSRLPGGCGADKRFSDERADPPSVEGTPRLQHHVFLRLSTNGSKAKRRKSLMGRSVVSVLDRRIEPY